MSPLDVSRAVTVTTAADFDRWLDANGAAALEVVVAIHNKSSGRQTVGLATLQETALCHGWVDTQTKRIDDERYAIRFTPRRAGSNWSTTNREMARRLLEAGKIQAAGRAALPADL